MRNILKMLFEKQKKPTKKQRIIFWGVVVAFALSFAFAVNWYGANARFVLAAKDGEFDQVQDFLRRGFNPNVRVPIRNRGAFFWFTPLDAAMTLSNVDVVSALLKAGADPNLVNEAGMSPLFAAVMDGDKPEIVRLLLKYGANVNQKNSFGYTALQMAIFQNSSGDVRELLNAGAPLDIREGYSDVQNKGNSTLMQWATFLRVSDDTDVLEILLQAGSDPLYQNKKGETALDILKERFPQSEVYYFLKKATMKKP